MRPVSVKVALTGPYAGKSKVLNRHQFINGVATIVGQPEEVNSALVYLGRSYQAYAVGSVELAAAVERDKANGIQHHLQNASSESHGTSAPVQGTVVQPPRSFSDPRALQGDGHAQGQAGSEGLVPSRVGHADAGLGERVEPAEERESSALKREIRKAMEGLDSKNDTHWTPDGQPSLDVVAEAVNQPALLRADLESIFPNWNRRKATEIASL